VPPDNFAPTVHAYARRPLAAAASLLALAAVGVAAVLSLAPPAPRPADAPTGEFSADRAAEHLAVVGARTHVAGSAANDDVREHLTRTLRGLGLRVAEQDTVGPEAGNLSGAAGAVALARVRNVVAVLPGTAPTGRVFLVAHYDSVQVGPGGNDDGAGTSAVLEVARALTAGPRPRNDLVFVLTDAEEACLCGAAAFAADHPLAADGGVVLNLEARGSTGPVIMFETSRGNADLVAAFGRAAPHPVGTSFAVEVYRRLPNDTDFTAFLDAGFAGLNSAYIDGAALYHTPLDTPANVDRASLQHHGENALGLAREFGAADLRNLSAGGDATYFPVPGGLVRYPGWLTWPLALAALGAVAALAWLARRRRLLSLPRLAAAFGLGLLPLVLAPLAAQVLWLAVTAIRPGYAELLDPYRPWAYRLAVVALASAVVLAWYASSRRRVGPAALAVGALGWLAALGLLLAATVPGGSYLAALPALAGGLAGVAALALPAVDHEVDHGEVAPGMGRFAADVHDHNSMIDASGREGRSRWAGVGSVVVLTIGAAVAVLVLLPAAVLLFPALGMAMGGAAAFLVVLLGFAALPLVELLLRRRRWAGAVPAGVAALVALACTGVGLAVDRFDADHPAPTHLMYGLDADTGGARWFSYEREPQPWTAGYVDAPDPQADDLFPVLRPAADGTLSGPAQAAPLPAPALDVLSDTAAGDVRTLRVRLRPQRTVRLAGLYVDAATARVDEATVGGRRVPVEEPADGPYAFRLLFHAPPADGIEVALSLRPPPEGGNAGRVRLRVLDGSDGLTDLPGFRPRPPDVGIDGSHSSELVLVTRTYTL
jgi:hypothetical protein